MQALNLSWNVLHLIVDNEHRLMNENLNPDRDMLSNDELEIEKSLRPKAFDDFTGQNQVLDNHLLQSCAIASKYNFLMYKCLKYLQVNV